MIEPITLDEAVGLGDIIAIKDAVCPKHGRIRPEMLAFPFSITREALESFPSRCGGIGCEEDIVVDAEAISEPLGQHLTYINDEFGPRVGYEVKPSFPGFYVLGVTPSQPDRPSGLPLPVE